MMAERHPRSRPVGVKRVSGRQELVYDAPGPIGEPNPNSMAETLRSQLRNLEDEPFSEGSNWTAIAQTLHRELASLGG